MVRKQKPSIFFTTLLKTGWPGLRAGGGGISGGCPPSPCWFGSFRLKSGLCICLEPAADFMGPQSSVTKWRSQGFSFNCYRLSSRVFQAVLPRVTCLLLEALKSTTLLRIENHYLLLVRLPGQCRQQVVSFLTMPALGYLRRARYC